MEVMRNFYPEKRAEFEKEFYGVAEEFQGIGE
jgi:hypothetical protein